MESVGGVKANLVGGVVTINLLDITGNVATMRSCREKLMSDSEAT